MSQSSLSIFSRICRRAFALYWLLRTFSSEEPAFTATSSLAVSREYLIRNSCETNAYKWSDRPEETNCASALKSHAVKVVCVTSCRFSPCPLLVPVESQTHLWWIFWFVADDWEAIPGLLQVYFQRIWSEVDFRHGVRQCCGFHPAQHANTERKNCLFGTPQRSESSHCRIRVDTHMQNVCPDWLDWFVIVYIPSYYFELLITYLWILLIISTYVWNTNEIEWR